MGGRAKARSLTRAAWLLVLLVSCAIRGESARLVLVVDTDISELDHVSFDVRAPDGARETATAPLSPGNPATHWIHKAGDQARGAYEVLVVGSSGGRPIVSRQALLVVVDGETRVATMHLVRACVGATCPGDQVCSERGCRMRFVAQGELTPWDGIPPRLSADDGDSGVALLDADVPADAAASPSPSGDDAAAAPQPDATPAAPAPSDAAVPPVVDSGEMPVPTTDAGSGPPPAVPDAASAPECVASRCEGDRFVPCSNGRLGVAQVCSASGACTIGSCQPERGCGTSPAADGTSCGSGLTCRGGTCTARIACEGDCSPSCPANSGRCELDCGASDANCKPSCGAGASCDIRCDATSNCDVQCAGSCNVSCNDVSNCEVRCAPGADCQIDCRSVEGNCKKVRCDRGARCLLRCAESEDCEFERCEGATRCANGDIACQRPCPP